MRFKHSVCEEYALRLQGSRLSRERTTLVEDVDVIGRRGGAAGTSGAIA